MKLVRFLTCGTTSAPAAVVGTGVRGSEPLPTVVAVCERADGSIWLIDAGWSAETCSEPARWIGRLRTTLLSLRIAPGDDVASQLRRAGLDPGKVTRIIATHLHLDHVGGPTEPMLWIADACCGAVTQFRCGDPAHYLVIQPKVTMLEIGP